jgi:hypothetical protein
MHLLLKPIFEEIVFERRLVMQKLMLVLVVSLMVLPLSAIAGQSKQPAALLQEARYAEDIDGNLDKAIGIYEQIIKDTTADAATKAQAMYLQGMCYMKKQNDAQAQAVLSKLVAQYPQQTKLVERAQATLLELTDSDPAVLMPPETIVYVEFGSPGKQIETILKMLQGTPLENPLQILGQPPASQQGARNPADIIAALLNPSMIAEFKKIRGMAIGVTEIKSNNPSIVAVLYPGKSDALRGLILAAVNMAGQPAESVEGMNILNINSQAGVAYDDNVFIIAGPMDLLKKSIELYKKKGSGGNLAQNNKSFSEISKEIRKQNLVTVWANVDQVYDSVTKQFPPGRQPEELLLTETFADPQNIDELIASLSINEASLNFDAKVNFKPGYKGLAYNLFRTANLSKDGFSNVPADAIALISFALSPNTGEKIQKPLQEVTGLDIGREIFDNIEQITIFAVPPADTAKKFNSVIELASDCIGVSITSKNPAQTNQVLGKILGTIDTLASLDLRSNEKELFPQPGRYLLPIDRRAKAYCYVGQSKTGVILSLSPEMLRLSQMQENSKSLLSVGPLQEPVSNLGPDASKLLLINAGGAIKFFETEIQNEISDSNGQQFKNALKNLKQIQTLFAKTYLQVQTNERADSFSLHAQIENLPPAKDVFPLVAQLTTQTRQQRTITAIAAAPSSRKLIAHWKFDETEGRTAKDSSPNHLDAVLINDAKWDSEGKVGGAVRLDGADGWIVLPEGVNQFSGGLTAIFWAKPESNALYGRFFEFGNGEQKDNIIFSRLADTNDMSFEIYPGDQWVNRIIVPNAIENGVWQSFAVAVEPNGHAVIYKDGKRIFEGTTGSPGNVQRKQLYIGKSQWPDDQMYKGLIDDFRIYNYVLSDQRIESIYNGTSNPQAAAAPAAYWKLDEKEGGLAKDSSGKLDGKIVGQPHWVSGKVGGALEFDGDENYIELPSRTSGGAFTITLWAYPTAAATWARFIDFGNGSENFADNFFLSRMGTSNNLILHVYSGIGASTYSEGSVEAVNAIELNKWQFFAATVDEDGTAAIYKDGKLLKDGESGVPGTILRTKNYIGKSFSSDDKLYKGMMDDIRLYDTALDADQIKAIYENALKP